MNFRAGLTPALFIPGRYDTAQRGHNSQQKANAASDSTRNTMSRYVQQEFQWPEKGRESDNATSEPAPAQAIELPPQPEPPVSDSPQLEAASFVRDEFADVPVAMPLPQAVEHGVFGMTTAGPIEPDAEEVRAMTTEQARELAWMLRDLQAVEDAARTGEDPRTGRQPRTEEAAAKLRQFLEGEEPRLKQAYADALSAYANGFGDDAAKALDLWVCRTVADLTIEPGDRYDPGHPWHYLPDGDNARPIPVDAIEPDIDAGRYIQQELPKNPAKRAERLRAMLAHERERVEEDKRRYQEIVVKGAEALSRYDREIAHTNDEMAVATALSLKYNHIRYGLGCVAWMERQGEARGRRESVFPDTQESETIDGRSGAD